MKRRKGRFFFLIFPREETDAQSCNFIFLSLCFLFARSNPSMESDGEELDYDFDTPQKPPLTASRMAASAGKNQGQPREEATGAVAKANDDANAGADGGGNKTKRANDDRDVEEELYGDIVSPGDNGGAGGSGGGGAALLTLQVAEVRT